MGAISLGAAAFWIALAAIIIVGSINKFRREQLKQETLLKLIEKTGQLDEAQVKLLFPPSPHAHSPNERPWWAAAPPDPLGGQRALRILGVILMALAAGVGLLSYALTFGTTAQQNVAMPWLGAGALLACLGIGLFFAARFATGPARRDEHG